MLNAPRCVPIYRDGRLEHFADMRGFIFDSASVSRLPDTEDGSSSGARNPRTGAAPFNLDACFKMGEGVAR